MRNHHLEAKNYDASNPFGKGVEKEVSFTDIYFDSFVEAMAEAGQRRSSLKHEGYITEIVKSPYDDRYVVCTIPDFFILENENSILKRFKNNSYGK